MKWLHHSDIKNMVRLPVCVYLCLYKHIKAGIQYIAGASVYE